MAQEVAIKITADGKAVVAAAQQASGALAGIDAQAGKTGTALDGTRSASEGLNSAMRDLDKSATAGGTGINLLAKGATMATTAWLAAGAVATGFVSKLIEVQRQYDVLNSSMVTVTGSAANAAREMAWIKTFAKDTPFGLEQVANGFVKMKALGLDPSQKALTSFGNTASAMGKDLSQMVEAVADASTGEFERLKEFGIKASTEGDKVSLTFQGVTTNIGNNAAEITKYLEDIGNVSFAGAMAERAKTLDGVISGLGDSWDELFRTIGAAGVSQAITNELSGLDNYLSSLTDHMNAAKASGAGMVGELSSGLGYLIARAPFDVLSSSANLLNGTLNLLTGGALGLNTSVNLLPDAFKTSAQQAVALAQDLKRAEAEFAALKAQSDKRGSNIYIQSELASLSQYIAKLKEAQGAKAALTGLAADPREANPAMTRGASYARWDQEQLEAAKALNAERMKGAGISKEYIASIKVHQDALRLGIITEKEATTAIGKLVQKQYESSEAGKEAAKSARGGAGAAKEAAAAQRELKKTYDDVHKSAQARANARNADYDSAAAYLQSEEAARIATVKAANQSVQAAQDEYDHYGKTKSQIAEVTLARLNDKLAGVNAGTEIAASIQLQIDAQKELIGILQKGEVREVGVKAAEAAASEWKKTADDIERGLTDSLFRAFESGKGFFSTLWSGIKNLFKTTVLKLAIQGVMGGVTGSIASVANAATSGGSLLSSLSSVGSLAQMGSAIGSGITQTIANILPSAVSAGLGMTSTALAASNAALIGGGASATAAASAAAAAGNATALGGIGSSISGALAGMGPVGWAALAATAAYAIFAKSGETRSGGQYGYSTDGTLTNNRRGTTGSGYALGVNLLEGPSGGEIAASITRTAIEGTVAGINTLLENLGSKAAITGFQAGLESSEKNRGGVFSGGTLTGGLTFGESGRGDNYNGTLYESTSSQSVDSATAAANFATDLNQAIVQALQVATDIPETIAKMVRGIDAEALGSDAVNALLGQISKVATEVTSFQAAAKALPFEFLKDMSFDAAAGLLAAAGGMEAFGGKLSSYYDNFYSEEEKRLNTLNTMSSALGEAGIRISAADLGKLTRAQFREWYESIATAFGAEEPMSMALLNVSDAFASITPIAEAAVIAVDGVVTSVAGMSEAMKNLMADQSSLQIELMRAQGNGAGADAAQYALDTTSLTGAERAVFDYNAGLRVQITALNDAAAAAEVAAQAADALKAANQGWQDQIDVLTGVETARSLALRDTTDESTKALMRQVYAQEDLKAASDKAAAQAQAIASERAGLQSQYDQLTMTASELQTQQRDGLDESNRALFDSINAVKEKAAADAQAAQVAEAAAQRITQSLKNLTAQSSALQIELMRANGDWAVADRAQYVLDTTGMTAAEKAIFDYNASLRKQITALNDAAAAAQAVASERAGLQQQYDQLTMTSVELLAQQRAGLDESNRALFDSINAVNAKTAADAAATQAAEAAAQAAAAIASERLGLQQQYDQLTMTSAELLAQQRDGLDESNRALFDSINAVNAKTAADAAAAQAAQEAAQAAAAIANERTGLERQLLQAQGDTAALRSLDRDALDTSNRALFDRINALQDEQAATQAAATAAEAMAQSLKALGDQTGALQIELMRAQGNGVGADTAQYAIDTTGMSAAEKAIFDYNAGLRSQITALNDAAAATAQAAEAAAQAQAAIANERAGLQQQYDQLTLGSVELLAQQRAGLDESNRALFDSINAINAKATADAAAAQAAQEAAQAASAIANERLGLESQLLQLQGDSAALRAIERAGLNESNRAVFDRIQALTAEQAAAQAATQAAEALAQATAAIATERLGLERQLLQLQGDTAAIRALELAAIDPTNQALQAHIWALQDEQAAAQAAGQSVDQVAQSIKSLSAQSAALQIELMRAQGNTGGADAAQYLIDTAGMSEAERAIFDYNASLRLQITALNDAAAAAQTAAEAAARAQEQAAADAARAMEQAAANAAAAVERILNERLGLEGQLLQLQGNTAELRRRELAALDPSNHALQQQIWALEDQKTAADDATQSAKSLADAWVSISDSLMDEVRRIRGLLAEGAGQSLAALQAQFAMATAQARAGDQGAAGTLAGLSQSLLEAAADQAVTLVDLQRMQAMTANSLEQTANMVGGAPAGGAVTGAGGLLAPTGDKRSGAVYVAPPVIAAPAAPVNSNAVLENKVETLTATVKDLQIALQTALETIAINTGKYSRTAAKWEAVGMPATRTA